MLTNLGMAGLALATGTLAARLLGASGRGELAAIQTLPTFAATFAMLGLPEAVTYFSARQPKKSLQYLSIAIICALIACTPVVIVGYYSLPFLLHAQSVRVIQAARIYLWILPIYAIVGMLQHPLRGRNDLVAWNLIRPLPGLAWLAILLVSTGKGVAQPESLSFIFLIALGLLIIPMGYTVWRRIPGESPIPSIADVKPMLRYGFPTMLSSVPTTLNLRLDQMIMAGVLGPDVLGLYVVGVAWGSAVLPILSALPSVILPQIAGAESQTQTRLIAQSTRLGVLICFVSVIAVSLLTPIAIPFLFGPGFVAAIPATIILTLANGFTAINQLMSSSALSLGKPRFLLIAESCGLLITIVLLAVLLKPFQLMGAAVTSLFSYMTIGGILLYLLHRESKLTIRDMLVPTDADKRKIEEYIRSLVKAT